MHPWLNRQNDDILAKTTHISKKNIWCFDPGVATLGRSQKREIRGEIMEISRIRVFNKKRVLNYLQNAKLGVGVVAIS